MLKYPLFSGLGLTLFPLGKNTFYQSDSKSHQKKSSENKVKRVGLMAICLFVCLLGGSGTISILHTHIGAWAEIPRIYDNLVTL